MSLLTTYILFTSILICLSLKMKGQHLNLEVNSSCFLSNGDHGVCKRIELCASAKLMLLNNTKPKICSFERDLSLIPIVCCAPGNDLPLDPDFSSLFKKYNFSIEDKKETDINQEQFNFITKKIDINDTLIPELTEIKTAIENNGIITKKIESDLNDTFIPQLTTIKTNVEINGLITEKIESDLNGTIIPELNKNKTSVEKCSEYSSKSYLDPPLRTTTTTTTTITPPTSEEAVISEILMVKDENSKAKEFPHVALLGYGGPNNTQWLCGGSLISENFVLTTANCLESREYGPVTVVRLGDLNIESDDDDAYPINYVVAETYPHPEYQNNKKYHDVALIRLNSSVDFNVYIKPACLYTEKELLNDKFIATGWGATSFGGNRSSILQKVSLKIADQKNCSKIYSNNRNGLNDGLIDDTQICAEGVNVGGDTCQGDSGGPLQYLDSNDDGLYKIVGITSFGLQCGLFPAIYTRVSYYVPWIEEIVWNQK